jgi:putative tricarboxylic transport membrane protein
MRLAEAIASFFWLTLSIALGAGSYQIGLGTPQEPESGFLPFWTAVLLGVLTIVHFIRTVYSDKSGQAAASVEWGKHWKRLIIVVIALTLYGVTLSFLGYVISTFLLLMVLFSVYGRRKWWVVVGASVIVVGITVIIFSYWLTIQLPQGLWGV